MSAPDRIESRRAPDAHHIARSSLAGILRYGLTVPLFVLTVPLILGPLGPERFAIWAFFGVLTAYAGLADLGIASGLVRFAAQAHSQRDVTALNRGLSTVIALYIVLGSIVAVLLFTFTAPIVRLLLNVPTELQREASVVVWGAAVAVALALLFGAFGSVLQGVHRLDLWNATLLVDSVVTSLGSVAVVRAGFGLPGLVFVRVASTLGVGLLSAGLAFRVVPGLHVSRTYVARNARRELVAYSSNILVSRVSILAGEPLVRVILAHLVTLASVTPFDIASRAAGQLRGVFSSALLPLLPASTSIQASGDQERLCRLYRQSTRLAAISAIPAFSGVAALSKPLVRVWLGPGNELTAVTLLTLSVVAASALVATPAYTILEGIGHARWNAVTTAASALAALVLSIAAGYHAGYWGVVIGYVAGTGLGFLATFIAFSRCTGISVIGSDRATLIRLPVVCTALAGAAIGLQARWPIENLSSLALAGTVYFSLLLLFLLVTRCISFTELRALVRLVRGSNGPPQSGGPSA